MPSANEVRSALLQIGVDIDNPDSVEAFTDAIDFARDAARRRARWQDIRRQIGIGLLISMFGGFFAAALSWLTSHTSGIGR